MCWRCHPGIVLCLASALLVSQVALAECDAVRRVVTYLGGSDVDHVPDVARDAEGHVYVCGFTSSPDFLGLAGWDPVELQGGTDAVVVKLSSALDEILAVRTLGGFGDDAAVSIEITDDGRLVIAGRGTEGFPTTGDAIQEQNAGDVDLFVAVLTREDLDLTYATLLGGRGKEWPSLAHIAPDGLVSITGHTESPDLPLQRPFQPMFRSGGSDSFVVQIRPDGMLPASAQLVYSTYLGGTNVDNVDDFSSAIDVAMDGRIALTFATQSSDLPIRGAALQVNPGGGGDAFVAVLDPALEPAAQLVYGSYLGGRDLDQPHWIRWRGPSALLLAGGTWSSTDFPTTDRRPIGGMADLFVAELSLSSSKLNYSTTLGGPNWDMLWGGTVNAAGDLVLLGVMPSASFPRVQGCYGFEPNGYFHALICEFRLGDEQTPGEILHSTSLGSGGTFDFLEHARGVIEELPGVYLVVGSTGSPNLPATDGALQSAYGGGLRDAFLARLDLRLPSPSFESRPAVGPAPLAVEFDARASTTWAGLDELEPLSLEWDFGDGTTGAGPTVAHTFGAAGRETLGRRVVTLTVEDALGHRATAQDEVTAHLATAVPPPWTSRDIGAPRFPGGSRPWVEGATDDFLICAGGTSLTGSRPEFHFLHQEAVGDFDLVAHLELVDDSAPNNTSLGLLFRDGTETAATTRFFALALTRTPLRDELRSRWRGEVAGSTLHGTVEVLRGWLKVERHGDDFTSWTSTDGAVWRLLEAPVKIPGLPATLLAGVFSITPEGQAAPSAFTPACIRASGLAASPPGSVTTFVRGDANADGNFDISDPIATLGYLFLGTPVLGCEDAADTDDNGELELTDAIYTLVHLFQTGPAPKEPSDACGRDATEDGLGCAVFSPCG